MQASFTSFKDENILYLRKFAVNIRKSKDGPQLLEDTAH